MDLIPANKLNSTTTAIIRHMIVCLNVFYSYISPTVLHTIYYDIESPIQINISIVCDFIMSPLH